MSWENTNQIESRYASTLHQEVEKFGACVQGYKAGRITEDEFKTIRLNFGIYGQRQPGMYLVRCKVPGGLLTAAQLCTLADVASDLGRGQAHITVRQNFEIHFVSLEQVPEVMRRLAGAGLSTRETCYNTVRNVTCCPLAGLAAGEVFDVRPYARQIAYTFMRNELTSKLPRKFKFALSGCPEDCIRTGINDVGLRAVIREEQGKIERGFRMVVGGGLGSAPRAAGLLDEFVPEDLLLQKCAAVLRVFDKYGNRQNRKLARLKFVLRDRGIEWIRNAVEQEFRAVLAGNAVPAAGQVPAGFSPTPEAAPPAPAPDALAHYPEAEAAAFEKWVSEAVRPQKQAGYAAVIIRAEHGNLTSAQMLSIARIAREAGDGFVRTTTGQNLAIAFIPATLLRRVHAALVSASLAGTAVAITDITACPGACTCNQALAQTTGLAQALRESLYTDPSVANLSIKISGCPNSCAHHWIADIGLLGNVRHLHGRKVAYYQVLLGGGFGDGGELQFGVPVNSVPARLAPTAVQRVLESFRAGRLNGEPFRDFVRRRGAPYFRELTRDLTTSPGPDSELLLDWGESREELQ